MWAVRVIPSGALIQGPFNPNQVIESKSGSVEKPHESSKARPGIKAHVKLKKDALALAVEQALDAAGWLPEVLKLPPEAAHFEVTNAGLAALEAAA